MRKRWLVLFLPLLCGLPVAWAADPSAGPSAGPGSAQQRGAPDVLPPCEDGVLYVRLRPLQAGQQYSDIEAASCEHPAPGQPSDPGRTAWAGAPDPSGVGPAANAQTAFSRTRAPAKSRLVRGTARRVYREAATGALIGQDFDLTSYRTLLVQWTGSAYGCTSGQAYAVPNVGTSLNDRIESSKSFSGCTRNYHYQNSSYTGSLYPCGTTCSTLGSLNNQTTSERWSR